MAITPLDTDLNIIAALDDEPNDVGGLTAAQLKAKFDEGGNAIRHYINNTLIPETVREINSITGGVVLGQIPDGSLTQEKLSAALRATLDEKADSAQVYTRAETLADSTKTLYGLTASAAPDEVLVRVSGRLNRSFVNILRLKLQQSLAASDIDAWADLLADGTRINAGAGSGYTLADGKLVCSGISQRSHNASAGFGTINYPKYGQTFTTPSGGSFTVNQIKTLLYKVGSPYDAVKMEIYETSSGLPTTLAGTSANTISGTSIPDIREFTFSFSGLVLSANTQYALVLSRTGATSDSNYYYLFMKDTESYPGGTLISCTTTTWSTSPTQDMYFVVFAEETSATVAWRPVTATQALACAAVTAEETLKNGTITFYLSDDGASWTEITDLDMSQAVNFGTASVYLKCVMTIDAELLGVAWGGY